MNALHKLAFGTLVVLVVAYAIIQFYGENILLNVLIGMSVVALLTLAVVRRLIASFLQLVAYLIQGVGYGIETLGGWMVETLQSYKDSLGGFHHSSVPDWSETQQYSEEENVGIDIVREPQH